MRRFVCDVLVALLVAAVVVMLACSEIPDVPPEVLP